MAPLLIAPDAVALALPYLRTALGVGITVSARIPSSRPTRLVSLRRAGGLRRLNNILGQPRIDAQVWDADEASALALADLVEAHLLAAPGLVAGVSRARTFLGPTPIPEPLSESPRVLLTVEWQVKGVQT